jgi:predicted DNA-binding WGR domain protein
MANIIESVTLNYTDLTGDRTGCTTLGSNKFWKGWVEQNGSGFNFECRWGPTGTPGSDKGSVRGTTQAAALDQLRKKVREKEAKGYTRLLVRDDAEEAAKQAAKGITAAPAVQAAPSPSKTFAPEVGRLLGVIYGSTASTVRAGLSAQAGATESNPIGNLSDQQLDLGGGILDEIEAEIRKQFGPESASNKGQTLPLDRDGVPSARIIDLTNRFMSNVPREIAREDRGRANLHRLVVSSYERLEGQRKFLQLLRDAHISKAVFAAAASQNTSTGREAVWYDGLGCQIEHLTPNSPDFLKVVEVFNNNQSQRNANWFRGGRSTLKVVNVFKFVRNGTEAAFERYATEVTRKPGAVGRIMAWHGTRTENLLGISKSGLLMPENLPRGVHISGKAFGRGIYHAPAWNATGHKTCGSAPTDGTNGALKSMNYTSATGAYYGSGNSANRAYMYLQDVALGIPEVHTSACWDKHRPDGYPTKADFIFACGSRNNGGFVHDELVTFHQDAQKFAYLVEVACI